MCALWKHHISLLHKYYYEIKKDTTFAVFYNTLSMRYNINMPTVLRIDGYRFFFYSSDRPEPVHIHIEIDMPMQKYGYPLFACNFSSSQINKILKLTEQYSDEITEAWNEFFND